MQSFLILLTLSCAELFQAPGIQKAADPHLFDGVVVSAGNGSLVVKDLAGMQKTYAVEPSTRVTIHGKPGRLEDLKLAMRVQVMSDRSGKVLSVSTIDREKGPAGP